MIEGAITFIVAGMLVLIIAYAASFAWGYYSVIRAARRSQQRRLPPQ